MFDGAWSRNDKGEFGGVAVRMPGKWCLIVAWRQARSWRTRRFRLWLRWNLRGRPPAKPLTVHFAPDEHGKRMVR